MRLVITKVLAAAQKGDLAISLAQLAAIRKRFPTAEVITFVRRPDEDRHWFVDADIVHGELFPASPRPGAIVRSRRLATCLLGQCYDATTRSFFEACKDADLVVFCGGGSLGGYGTKNLLRNALCPVLLARRAKTPIYFSGLSLAPLSSWRNRIVATWILNNVDFITLREPASSAVLSELGVRTPKLVTADWAMLIDPIEAGDARELLRTEGVRSSRPIGITLRDIRAIDPEGRAARIRTPYREKMTRLIREIVNDLGDELVIFPMNRPPASNDLAFAQELICHLPKQAQSHVRLMRGDYTPAELKGMIGQMQLFVSTRLHPSIFAISSCVPTVTIHDHVKVSGFMELAGMSHWHVPFENYEVGSTLRLLQELRSRREEISGRLGSQVKRLRDLAWGNVKPIESLARCA